MDDKVFPNPKQVPDVITDIVNETGLNAMSPGETAWTVPHALTVDEEGVVSIKSGMVTRGKEQGGTVNLKVVMDFDGVFVDATALSRSDLERTFKPHGPGTFVIGGAPETTAVGGILYPFISESDGLDPKTVQDFNSQQRVVRQRFSEYYRSAYNQEYRFANQEYTGFGNRSMLGTVAQRGATTTPAPSAPKRRWGRS